MTTLLLLNALACIGFHLVTREGMLLHWVDRITRDTVLYNAICGCVTCMASLWSWPYLVMIGLDWMYIVYVLALSALNTLLYDWFFDEW